MRIGTIPKDNFQPTFHIEYIDNCCKDFHYIHFHSFFEIYLSLCDNKKYYINNKVYELKKHDLVLINHLDIHRFYSSTEFENSPVGYIILFAPEYIRDLSTANTDLLECFTRRGIDFSHCLHLTSPQAMDLFELFVKADKLSKSAPTQAYGHDINLKMLFVEILLKIHDFYHTKQNTFLSTFNHNSSYQKISPIIEFINVNLTKAELSLDYLAHLFHMNKTYLSRIFKQTTGYTVNDYITLHRITIAKQLLQKNTPITHIIEMTGFHNYLHFVRTFKQIAGMTPSKYLKQ